MDMLEERHKKSSDTYNLYGNNNKIDKRTEWERHEDGRWTVVGSGCFLRPRNFYLGNKEVNNILLP